MTYSHGRHDIVLRAVMSYSQDMLEVPFIREFYPRVKDAMFSRLEGLTDSELKTLDKDSLQIIITVRGARKICLTCGNYIRKQIQQGNSTELTPIILFFVVITFHCHDKVYKAKQKRFPIDVRYCIVGRLKRSSFLTTTTVGQLKG